MAASAVLTFQVSPSGLYHWAPASPGHRLERGRVVGEEGADPNLLVGLLDLLGGLAELVPGLGDLDAVLLEQVLAVVERLRRGVERDGPVLAAERRQLDRLRQQLLPDVLGEVLADVLERALTDVLRKLRVLDGDQVGGVACLDRVGDLGVAARVAGRDLLVHHLDVLVRGVERVNDLLGPLGPAPEGDADGLAVASGGGFVVAAATTGRENGEGGGGADYGEGRSARTAAHSEAPEQATTLAFAVILGPAVTEVKSERAFDRKKIRKVAYGSVWNALREGTGVRALRLREGRSARVPDPQLRQQHQMAPWCAPLWPSRSTSSSVAWRPTSRLGGATAVSGVSARAATSSS